MQQAGHGRWRRALHTCGMLLLLTLLASCALPSGELGQGGDLPSLRHLEWGYSYYQTATWSPDGQWIALLAGSDTAHVHLVVLSPDGRTRHDLNDWGCDKSGILRFGYAWLPDSALGCVTDTGKLVIGSAPFTAPTTVPIQLGLTPRAEKGATWTPDGAEIIVTSITDPTDPVHYIRNDAFYVVSHTGTVMLTPLTPAHLGVKYPLWAPNSQGLAYLAEPSNGAAIADLLFSAVSWDAQGRLILGASHTLATGVDQYYTWSPSGRWIAVRHGDYRGGDKIYLLNPANPAQTLDVVLADRVGQQMMDPIWSPDGNTMIVFTVGYGSSQPYSLDIGAYLRSKGLQP